MITIRFTQAALVGLGMTICAALHAQGSAKTYPERPIKVILGYAAGGLPDTVGRLVQQKLSERWGQQVLTENRPGSGGIAAAEMVANAPGDGYTLQISDSSMLSINPYLYAKLPYSEKDFISVSIVARAALFLAVNNTVPANTLKELIALAKSKPGQLSYGSSGIGTVHHLGMEALKSTLGLDIVHIPYKGTGQSVPAMIGGQVAMVYSAYPSLSNFAKDGKVKLLAANSRTRSALAPDIPTVAEITGIADYDFSPTIGYLAPAGTPRDIIMKLSTTMAEIVKLPEIVQRFAGLGIEPVGSTPEDQTAQWKSDAERFSKVVKSAGAKAE